MNDNNYDVGIVGFWYGLNYGSILTYYALYKAVEERGKKPILVNKPLTLWDYKFYDKKSLANRFFAGKCKTSRIRKDEADWRELNKFCKMFLVGSDVVWKSTLPKRCGYHFFLDFVAGNKKKIAYAPSFGGEWEADEIITNTARYYLDKFDYISCRENEGVKICEDIFHVSCTQVVDPVFLIDYNNYHQLADSSKIMLPEKYIVSYVLGPGSSKRQMLLSFKSMIDNSEETQLINIVNAGNEERGAQLLKLDTVQNLNVEDWLCYIKNCSIYIGDSFHGICFSIIFKKNFILIRNRISPSRCRFDTLLSICDLENRSIYADEDITERKDLLEPIDYEKVYEKLGQYIERSKDYLTEALLSEHKTGGYNEQDVLIDIINELKKENCSINAKVENLEQQIKDILVRLETSYEKSILN